MSSSPEPAVRPVLRVVRGTASPEELAALLAVLATAGSQRPAPPSPASSWNARARALRQPLPHGPNAWRDSALPG